MARAVRAVLAACMLGSAVGVVTPRTVSKAAPVAPALDDRTRSLIHSRSVKAATFLEGQATRLAVPEMELLALRVSQVNTMPEDFEASYKEALGILRNVNAKGGPHLHEFCSAEKKKTGEQLAQLQANKTKAQAKLVGAAQKADKLAKEIAGLKGMITKSQQSLSALERARAQSLAKYAHIDPKHKRRASGAKLSKDASGAKLSKEKISLSNVKAIAAAQNAASDALMQSLNSQMQEASRTAEYGRKVRQLSNILKSRQDMAATKEAQLKRLKADLVQQAQEFQHLQQRATLSERYQQEIDKKCSTAGVAHQKQQPQEEVKAIETTFRILTGN